MLAHPWAWHRWTGSASVTQWPFVHIVPEQHRVSVVLSHERERERECYPYHVSSFCFVYIFEFSIFCNYVSLPTPLSLSLSESAAFLVRFTMPRSGSSWLLHGPLFVRVSYVSRRLVFADVVFLLANELPLLVFLHQGVFSSWSQILSVEFDRCIWNDEVLAIENQTFFFSSGRSSAVHRPLVVRTILKVEWSVPCANCALFDLKGVYNFLLWIFHRTVQILCHAHDSHST